jgi:O-methyltransferase involved in polyketide biosynthesis
MGLPDLSNMMKVGQLRHIQAFYEEDGWRNPDTFVRHLLTPLQRAECALRAWLGPRRLQKNDPFYFYLLARTLYYDSLFAKTIEDGTRFIVNIGCGGDTRAYRWRAQLVDRAVAVVECDQPGAIREKRRLAQRYFGAEHVEYLGVDLNTGAWTNLKGWLDCRRSDVGLVMLEGVSPYIERCRFEQLLRMLASTLNQSSVLAYDYKVAGVNDRFGAQSGEPVWRLSRDEVVTDASHRELGFRLIHFENSVDLTSRLLLRRVPEGVNLFTEDVLLQLAPTQRR